MSTGGQEHPDRGPRAHGADGFDMATMRLGQVLDDGEAEAGAAHLAGSARAVPAPWPADALKLMRPALPRPARAFQTSRARGSIATSAGAGVQLRDSMRDRSSRSSISDCIREVLASMVSRNPERTSTG